MSSMPKLYIVSGCNGSGKTTASYSLLPEMLECSQFVNSDEFAKGLSPYGPEKVPLQASRYMLMKIKYLFKKRKDFGIETTLATRTLLKMVAEAQRDGYFVTVIYFWLESPALASERVKARVEKGGHNIPEETIVRRYYMGLEYFFEDYMKVCDRWILADNSYPPFKVVAEGFRESGEVLVRDAQTFEKIKGVYEDYKDKSIPDGDKLNEPDSDKQGISEPVPGKSE